MQLRVWACLALAAALAAGCDGATTAVVGGAMHLRGGRPPPGKPSKLSRSYSISAIMPTAADPDHLSNHAASGPLDVNMVTTRNGTIIEARITSNHGGMLMKEEGTTLMMHWGADDTDEGDWHRPPPEMLPPGTNYRFNKHSVQTPFKLNDQGQAEVVLTVPDVVAPRKIRFITFVSKAKADGHADFWFKNSNEGDFEMYVCPWEWKVETEKRLEEEAQKKKEDEEAQKKSGGIFGFLRVNRAPSNLTEGEEVDQDKAPSPPRSQELDGSWRPRRVLQRSKSAELRHYNQMQREAKAKEVSARWNDDRTHVKLSVMLPLDLHKWRIGSLERRLKTLKDMGVHGVMCDIWWGLVEQQPKQYDFTRYLELARLGQKIGLEVEFVMSFHKCGGNVGDSCHIPLPKWVQEAAKEQGRDLAFYTDRNGNTNDEYIAGAADEKLDLQGRTPLQCYHDFMEAFADNFDDLFHTTISKVQIGMGPAGELRYPSFPLSRWCYPGPGSFQCYDRTMKEAWKEHCKQIGKPDWEKWFPETGGYDCEPDESKFFREHISQEYGKTFLRWYADMLYAHGRRVLGEAQKVFAPYKIEISGKIAGIHWLYCDERHAAEVCAGYYNANMNNAYEEIAGLFKEFGATFDFTCMEIQTGRDVEKPYQSDPEALVWQAKSAAEKVGVKFAGENALPVFEYEGFDMILKKAGYLDSFCFLRLTEELLTSQADDFRKFCKYIKPIKRPKLKSPYAE